MNGMQKTEWFFTVVGVEIWNTSFSEREIVLER